MSIKIHMFKLEDFLRSWSVHSYRSPPPLFSIPTLDCTHMCHISSYSPFLPPPPLHLPCSSQIQTLEKVLQSWNLSKWTGFRSSYVRSCHVIKWHLQSGSCQIIVTGTCMHGNQNFVPMQWLYFPDQTEGIGSYLSDKKGIEKMFFAEKKCSMKRTEIAIFATTLYCKTKHIVGL